MKTKHSVAVVSVSALAAGMAQGAVIHSGPLNLQQNWQDPNYRQAVDMNSDGVNDFTFGYEAGELKPYVDVRPTLTTPNQSGMADLFGQADRGLPLTTIGTMIDASYTSTFPLITDDRGYFYQNDGGTVVGDWPGDAIAEGYVGIQLTMNSETRYGWLHFINNPTTSPASLTLVDWAYESTPGVGIETSVIPEPSTLSLAGLGIAALLGLRKRR